MYGQSRLQKQVGLYVWNLYTSVSHVEGEVDFVGESEILMSIHESFISLVFIQLLI